MSTSLGDLSGLQGMLAQLTGNNAAADPLVVQPGDTDTEGMSFAELFSHYLAPEVAKLTPSSSSAPMTDLTSPFVFGGSAPSTSTAGSTSGDAFSPLSPSTSFDPSTFMPTIPGSPFSHSSDGNSGHSPFSLADLDFSSTTVGGVPADGFAIDPSVFGPPAETNGFDQTMSLALPPAAALPLLPALPIAPIEQSQPQEQPQQLTASGRPKRNVAHTVIDEEDEDDLYSSDGSVADTSGTSRNGRRTSRKPSAAKKARSSLASSEEPPSSAASRKQVARSVAQLASATLHKTSANSHLPPVPQWADKPDPEEYSKLSSKEKRQLRNKLSARNFRHRRKEYITTLEEQIHDRDTIIATLRDEVGVMRAENSGLKTEVATLKEKWQDLLDKLSSLSAPPTTAAAGLGTNPSRAVAAGASVVKQEDAESSVPAAGPSTRRIGTRAAVSSSNSLQLPNFSKDVSAHARRSTGAWSTASPGLGGGFMSVHTTLIPDVAPLADGVAPKLPLSSKPFSNQSFNPALNALSQNQIADLPALTSHLRTGFSAAQHQGQQQAKPVQQTPKGTFEDFFASNPFWLRPDQLEQNRAALYGKLANNAAGLVAAQKEQQQHQQPQQQDDAYLPVPQGFKPAFFRSPKLSTSTSPTTSELLAYQSPAAFSSPPPLSHQDALALREQAMSASVAHLASQTLMQRMMASFWDAFSGSPASSGLSADKVKAVLGGKARVEVVPVSAPASPKAAPASIDALGAQMGGLRLDASTSDEASSSSCSFTQQVHGRRWIMEKRA
ncbi:bZIP transcription factor [Rhodotorula toruloides]|uniref:BZIP transcription factor n=1 Tax=Rhodotorula toruloides TaxID=5286 RepID=A0A511KBU6_RHOTO|nr:bZIP transcription factor [Rhodotorula toruloides]